MRITAHGDGSGQTRPKGIEEEAAPAAEHAAVHEGDVDGLAAAGAAALEQVHGEAPAGVVVGAHVAQADVPQLLSAGAGLDVDRVRRVRAAAVGDDGVLDEDVCPGLSRGANTRG